MLIRAVVLAAWFANSEPSAGEPPPNTAIPARSVDDDADGDGVAAAAEILRGTDPDVPGLFPGAYPHIPEPMVFDLVRGLGARRGEFEFNTLVGLQTYPGAEIHWAPEIEWAVRDRLAVEFELPMSGASVEAFKFALQGTVADARPAFIHGWQILTETSIEGPIFKSAVLYLAGRRLGRRVSIFGMLGPEALASADGLDAALLVNPSVFVDLAEVLTLGVETNVRVQGVGSAVAVYPQLHWQVFRHMRVQLGAGPAVGDATVAAESYFRIIVE